MQSISTLMIGVNGEFRASLPGFFEFLGDRVNYRLAPDFDQALAALATQSADLVLVDAALVETGNNADVARMRTLYPAIKILLLTIFDRDFYAEPALSINMDGVISREKFAGQFVRLLDTFPEHPAVKS
ncbi:MAG: hypothetical protein HKN70_13830 [Gammaproteobacteria bacterium]|nr:hypothetical protein [Gammaproteobacteria bacterium]